MEKSNESAKASDGDNDKEEIWITTIILVVIDGWDVEGLNPGSRFCTHNTVRINPKFALWRMVELIEMLENGELVKCCNNNSW